MLVIVSYRLTHVESGLKLKVRRVPISLNPSPPTNEQIVERIKAKLRDLYLAGGWEIKIGRLKKCEVG